MEEVYIRKMDKKDVDAVYGLEQSIFRGTAWSKNSILYAVSNKTAYNFVMELDNNIIGYIFLRIIDAEAHILNFAIDRRFQKKGFGKKLLEYGIDFIKKYRCMEIYLEVREDNIAARALYEKIGFESVFIRDKYYADNGNAVIYLLKL